MPSQYFWAMASFAVRVSTLPESQRLGTITLSSTIASAMSGLRRQFPDSSFPCDSAVARMVARMYDWYLSGMAAPVSLTTVVAPMLALLRI